MGKTINSIMFVGRKFLSLRYKVKINGFENIDINRPVLFLPNHIATVDPMILVSLLYKYKKISPVITASYYDMPIVKTFFKKLDAIRVSDLEAGSRNLNVLSDILKGTKEAFKKGNSVIIYPSGMIARQNYERILNKKSAFNIVDQLDDNIQVIGIRTKGLWGSIWTWASGKYPAFGKNLLLSFLYVLANLIFFVPKRNVIISFYDITKDCKEMAKEGQRVFNIFLEDFYNQEGKEKLTKVKHFFFF